MSRYKPRGWTGESHRHYLAAKGIKTKYEYYRPKEKLDFKRFYQKKAFNIESKETPIPIKVTDPLEGRIYPVAPEDVISVLENQDAEHLDGIKSFEFVNPRGMQNEAWAQYVRSTSTIKIFSQPFKDGKIDGESADKINKHLIEYVIPHEIGHHRALNIEKITDEDIEMAETRADAHVYGFSPKDSDMYEIWSLRNNN